VLHNCTLQGAQGLGVEKLWAYLTLIALALHHSSLKIVEVLHESVEYNITVTPFTHDEHVVQKNGHLCRRRALKFHNSFLHDDAQDGIRCSQVPQYF
jgi:hypothetical protein